jgi:hypothetical protein
LHAVANNNATRSECLLDAVIGTEKTVGVLVSGGNVAVEQVAALLAGRYNRTGGAAEQAPRRERGEGITLQASYSSAAQHGLPQEPALDPGARTTALIVLIASVTLALIVSGLCSVSESVVLSVSRSHVEQMAKSGSAAGRILRNWKKSDIEKPIAAILILNTFAHNEGHATARRANRSARRRRVAHRRGELKRLSSYSAVVQRAGERRAIVASCVATSKCCSTSIHLRRPKRCAPQRCSTCEK